MNVKLREVLFAALMLQHDFYPCCGIDHPPNEGRGEKCKTSGLFVAMQNTAAGRKQARPAVSRGSRNQHNPGTLYFYTVHTKIRVAGCKKVTYIQKDLSVFPYMYCL